MRDCEWIDSAEINDGVRHWPSKPLQYTRNFLRRIDPRILEFWGLKMDVLRDKEAHAADSVNVRPGPWSSSFSQRRCLSEKGLRKRLGLSTGLQTRLALPENDD